MPDASADNLSVFVLAGGKSSRMGSDKAFLQHEGQTLLDRSLAVARSISADVWIVGNKQKFSTYGRVLEDIFPERGPLGGIHSALLASQNNLNLMVAVDMPFVSPAFLEYFASVARASDVMAVIPRVEGRLQPLCAIYRRDFAAIAETALLAGNNKIGPLFVGVSIRVIEEEELVRCGFSRDLFRNLNTPQDLAAFNAPTG
jgi:molybdopterin-guanine dinucleotide biosynthesis protein A